MMENCEWCGKLNNDKFEVVIADAYVTKDGNVISPARFGVCSGCMNLYGNRDYDKLTERVLKREK